MPSLAGTEVSLSPKTNLRAIAWPPYFPFGLCSGERQAKRAREQGQERREREDWRKSLSRKREKAGLHYERRKP